MGKPGIKRRIGWCGLAVWCCVAVAAPAATAATLTVTTTSDTLVPGDGQCSLREAVAAANAPGSPSDCGTSDASATTIVLGPHTYLLSIPALPADDQTTGDLDVNATAPPLTIAGAGVGATEIFGGGSADRVLHVLAGANVTIKDLTVSGGRAPDGADQPKNNGAGSPLTGGAGFNGGGIFNSGTLSMVDAAVTDNTAGNGGKGGDGEDNIGQDGATGGAAGAGGGIYNTGTLTLTGVTVSGNQAGAGGVGGAGGEGAMGDQMFSGFPGGSGGNGGCCGDGGGLENAGGSVMVTASTFTGNHAGRGGNGGNGGNGGPAGGAFGPGLGGPGGTGAGGSSGGAISSAGGAVSIINATIGSNATGVGGSGGSSPDAGAGGSHGGGGGNGSAGGGVFVTGGATATLTNVTVVANQVGGPGGIGDGSPNGAPGQPAFGGGVYTSGTPAAQLRNTLLASNQLGNCAGTAPLDLGHNLSFGDATCPAGFGTGDPKLDALRDNGGPTETIGLGPGSAAIDQVPASGAGCPATDQRGVARPSGAGCDIGAYEVAPPSVSPSPTTAVTADGAELHGSVVPDSAAASAHFVFGTTTAYGSTTPTQSLGGGVQPQPVSSVLSGLQPHTTYHFRLVAGSADGTTETGDMTFTTAAPSSAGAPSLTDVRIKPSKFHYKSKKGATISYTDSAASTTEFAVLRCVKKPRHARKCTQVATFTNADRPGANEVHLGGRLGGHVLPRGRYEVQATPTAGGQTGKTVRLGFRVT